MRCVYFTMQTCSDNLFYISYIVMHKFLHTQFYIIKLHIIMHYRYIVTSTVIAITFYLANQKFG